MFWNKRKKKIIALEALLKSSAKTAEMQVSEIKILEKSNDKLFAENEALKKEKEYFENQIYIRDQTVEAKVKQNSVMFNSTERLQKSVGELLAERKQLRATITRISNKLKKLQSGQK